MKRILALLLVVMQCSIIAYAEFAGTTDSTPEHAQALTALGIIDELDEKAFSVDEPISRNDFVQIISGLVNYKNEENGSGDSIYYRDVLERDGIAGKVDYLTGLGFVSGYDNGLFQPEENVKTIHVITVLAKILGYEIMAEQSGGYPYGYVKSLRKAGVEFTLESIDQIATGTQVTELVYQALDAKMYLVDMNGEVYRDDNENILSKYHDIKISEGIVTAVDYSDETKSGRITINEEVYYYESRDIERWSGLNVKYFYDEYDTAVYLEQTKKNKIIELDTDLISQIKDGRFYYYTNKTASRTDSKQIGASVDYIYNGVRVIPQKGEDMNKYLPKYEGNVRLVDNNNDGTLDYIIILDYDTFVVNDLITEECIYYDKYTQRINTIGQVYAQKPLDLSNKEVEFAHIIDAMTGVFLERSDITKDSVLSVARSLDGSVVHIIVSGDSITGTVTSAGTDDKGRAFVEIEGKKYIVSKVYTDFKGNIPIGTTATFKLTGGNMIADFDVSSSYAYLIDAKENEEEDGIIFQLYTAEGNFEKIQSAQKLTINQHKNVSAENALVLLKNGQSEIESGVVILEKNSEGKIRKIYTKDAETASEKHLYKRSCFPTSSDYDSDLSVFYSSDVGEIVNKNTKNIGGKVAFKDDTILFDIPFSPKTASRGDFGVSTMSSYPHYTYIRDIEIYSSDEKNITSDVIVRQSTGQVNIPQNQEAVVISHIDEVVDEFGDVVVRVRGYRIGEPVSYLADEREKLMAQRVQGTGGKIELGVGDVARFTLGQSGRIIGSEIMIDASNTDSGKIMQSTGDAPNTSNRFNHGFRLQKAKIYRIERGHIVITRDDLADTNDKPVLPETYELMPTDAKTHCWLVDFGAKTEVEEINLLELKDYMSYGTECDEVYIYQRESAYDILIYR